MAVHRFVGIDRGNDGFKGTDFEFGTFDPATADSAVAASQALEAAVTAAVSAAAANGTIAGDGPALALVQAIQTAFNLLIAANVTAKAATAALALAIDTTIKDIALVVDETSAMKRVDIQKAVRAFERVYAGGPTFTTWPPI